MTENQEGLNQGSPEAGAMAGTKPSGENGEERLSEQGSQGGSVTLEQFNQLLSEVRGLQGKMDKDAAATEKRLKSEFEELRERLKLDLSPEQQQEYRMYQLEQQIGDLTSKGVPAKEQSKPSGNFAEVFNALGISEPSVDDMKIAMEHADNPILLAAELTKRQLAKPTPTPAGGVVPGNARSASPADANALVKEFDSLAGKSLSEVLPGGKTVLQRRAEITAQLEGLDKN